MAREDVNEVYYVTRAANFGSESNLRGNRTLRAACLHLRSHFLLDLCVDLPLLRAENHLNPLVAFLHDASGFQHLKS
jgi:hypothetical protein